MKDLGETKTIIGWDIARDFKAGILKIDLKSYIHTRPLGIRGNDFMPSNGSSRESLIISFHGSSRRLPPKKLYCIPTADKKTNVPGLQNPT